MKLQKKLILGVVCAVIMLLVINVVCAADVVIKSVGFEDGESWGGMMPMPTQIKPVSITTTEDKHSGAKSVKLAGQAGGYGAYLSSFPVTSGEVITIKFWAKSTNGGKLGFHGAYGISSYYSFPAASSWTEFTYNLNTATSNYNPLQIILFGDSSGTTYYDDFLITRRGVTPTPTRNVTVTPTPTNRPTPTVIGTPIGGTRIPPTQTPTPTPRLILPTPTSRSGYTITWVVQSDWGTGCTVSVTIKNNDTGAVYNWTLVFTFPGNQTITNMWNATYTQSGATVTIKGADFNSTIPGNGGTVNFGFNMNYNGLNSKPITFTLNGVPCQLQ